MEAQPSTSAGISKATTASDGGRRRTSTDGVQEGVISTSGSAASAAVVQQEENQVILNRVTFKQCQQLLQATCRIKLQRCDDATTPATNSRPVLKTEEESDLSDTGSSSSEEDEVKVLPTPPPTKKKAVAQKNPRKRVVHRKSPVQCRVCGKSMSSKSSLKIHMRKHTGETRYRCDHCGMSFWNLKTFRGHIGVRAQRNGVCPRKYKVDWRPKGAWKCQICGKSMKNKSNYVSHMRIHRDEKPFKCGDCGKVFGRNPDLTRHKRIHSGGWQFSCVFCEKGFHQQQDYRSHLRAHTEEKPYFCMVDGCGKSFRHSKSLRYHRRFIHLKKY